jgi:hypothetical protein
MTDTTPGGWPDKPGVPQNPERDGWHWVMMREGVPFRPRACFWDASRPGWAVPGSAKLREDAGPEWRYLGPCHTPAEVAALVEAVRRDEREAWATIVAELAAEAAAEGAVIAPDGLLALVAAIRARGDALKETGHE